MKVATAPIAQVAGVTSIKKKALLARVRFGRREFRLTRRHSDTIIPMNSRQDPCAAGNLPPTIGRLISCRRSVPQEWRHDVPNFVAVQGQGRGVGLVSRDILA